MSMPSSRLEVATTHGSAPRLRSSSISARCSLDTEPWWARAITTAAPSVWPRLGHDRRRGGPVGRRRRVGGSPASRAVGGDLVEARGEPLREPAGVGEDDRRAVLLDQVDDPLLDVRPDRAAPLAARGRPLGGLVAGDAELGHVLDGDDHLEVPLLGGRRRDDLDGCAAAEEARDLLDRPNRRGQADALGGRPVARRSSSSSRSRDRARWAPRLVPATACTSSTITVSTPRSDSRAWEVSIRNSDSGVVIRMSGGVVAEPAPVLRRGVARPDAHGDVGNRARRAARRCAGCRSAGRAGCARRRRRAP